MAQTLESKNSTVTTRDIGSDLNSQCRINRRSFFESLRDRALDAATAGVAAVSLSPAVGSASLALGIGTQDAIVNKTSDHQVDQLNRGSEDFIIQLARGGSINVLGLFHTSRNYERARAILEPKIARADIVLHERGEWFDTTIGDPARSRGQKVGVIEGSFTQGKGALVFIASTAYLVMKGYEQLLSGFHYATRAILGKSRDTVPRRTVLSNTAKMGGALIVGLPVASIAADISGHDSLRAFDISPLADGRTVKMLDNAFLCAEKHPGTRIAVVIGNGHASGMRFYMESPTNRKIFEAKRTVYKGLQLNAVDFSFGDKSSLLP